MVFDILKFFFNSMGKYWIFPLLALALSMGCVIIHKQGYQQCRDEYAVAAAQKQRDDDEKQLETEKQLNAVAVKYQEKVKQQNDINNQLQIKLDAELKKKIYSDCVVPVDGVQLFNKALAE